MKTLRQWVDGAQTLSSEDKQFIFKEISNGFASIDGVDWADIDEPQSFRQALGSAFVWEDSPQGRNYWVNKIEREEAMQEAMLNDFVE